MKLVLARKIVAVAVAAAVTEAATAVAVAAVVVTAGKLLLKNVGARYCASLQKTLA
jgi:hypothetical protein